MRSPGRALALTLSLLLPACGDAPATPRPVPGTSPAPGSAVNDAPEPPELPDAWSLCSCVTCHGTQSEGTGFGPELVPVIRRYLAVEGSREKARERLIGYLLEPQKVPTLRDDDAQFSVPMPPLSQVQGTRKDAETLADYLLSLARGGAGGE